jgi:hypothetical protein
MVTPLNDAELEKLTEITSAYLTGEEYRNYLLAQATEVHGEGPQRVQLPDSHTEASRRLGTVIAPMLLQHEITAVSFHGHLFVQCRLPSGGMSIVVVDEGKIVAIED